MLSELEQALSTGPVKKGLQAFVEILRSRFEAYAWVGVYLVKGDKLVLEVYAGNEETEHVAIPIGQGICGAAAESGATLVVPDVSKDPRYLMCFPSTRSEIVVPVKGRNGVLGEIDLDSDRLDAFSERDRKFLERVAVLLAGFLEKD